MSETNDRVENALAAHIDYLEMGGSKPDTGHLTPSERERLEELIRALELTEGVAFGLGRREEIEHGESSSLPAAAKPIADDARKEHSDVVFSQLRERLPSEVHIEPDTTTFISHVGSIEIVDRWIVGTFGGRVRVWLLAVNAAQEIERDSDCLTDLNQIFGMLSDTSAIALVAEDLSCLMVQPEDTAPQIRVPGGSLVGRRYRRSIQPAGEAVGGFLEELMPYWDPVPAFEQGVSLDIDVAALSDGFVATAVEKQRGIGERARKGNPKKDALLGLGEREMAALRNVTNGLFDGSVDPDEVAVRIEKLAKNR